MLRRAHKPAPMPAMADVSPATWQPIFATQPILSTVSPDARDMATQIAHFNELVSLLPINADEAMDVVAAFQRCEQAHGYPCIAQALNKVIRLMFDALDILSATLPMLAEQRSYTTLALWVGELVEQYACLPQHARQFTVTAYAQKAGSPYCEFEDVEQGQLMASKLGELNHKQLMLGETKPFVALAAAMRQQLGGKAIEMLRQLAYAASSGPAPLQTFIHRVDELALAQRIILPIDWARFVNAHNRLKRAKHSHQRTGHGASSLG